MAKALTMPTAPEAPIAPQVSIGERIHNIENRIEEIESISGMSGNAKSNDRTSDRQSSRQAQEEEEEAQDEQEESESQAAQQPQRQQSTPQVQQNQPRNVTTPETMARDAVANGSGALTKRTTKRGGDDSDAKSGDTGSQSKNQSTVVIPPNSSALNDNGQTRFERGRAVLNEFKQLDQEEGKSSQSADKVSSSTSTPGIFAPTHNSSAEHGAAYWLFTVIAVVILAFVFIRQFLVNKNSKSKVPPLTKSTLDIPDISKPLSSVVTRQSAASQYNQNKVDKPTPLKTPKTIPTPAVKPVTLKTKSPVKTEDDNKGKHFEVRV